MELTLKDQSVIEIGQEIGDRVGQFKEAGTSLVPANQMAPAGAVAAEVQPMNPFESMMMVLQDIRDGIYNLVDRFSDGISVEREQLQQQEQLADNIEAQQDAADLGATEGALEDTGGDDQGPSMLDSLKEKASLADTSFKGLLVKGAIIGVLLGLATALKKYGKQIAEFVAPVVDGIKEFVSYVKDDIGVLFDDMIDGIKTAFSGIFKTVKGIFGGDGELIKEGLAELLTLPAKFVSMVGKLVVGVIDALMGVFGIDPRPEWVQNLYDFFDDFPANVKAFFKGIADFFTVTIPTKIQEAKDTVTGWFTDMKTGITDFFTDVKNFFTKTIPEKMAEIGKGISDKFTEIKDEIVGFAMAPFKKIKQLMQDLLVGILESVEGLPFIGDKAKALKESILGTGSAETLDTAGTGDASIAESIAQEDGKWVKTINVDDQGNVLSPVDGKMMKMSDEEQAKIMASELSGMGQGTYEPVYDDGGFFGRAFYRIRKTGEEPIVPAAQQGATGDMSDITGDNIASDRPTSGAELNAQSAEFAASQGAAMGGASVAIGGSTSNNTTAISQHNYTEDTTTGDRTFSDAVA